MNRKDFVASIIQRWWKRTPKFVEPLIQNYIHQIQTNYCHRLELFLYAIKTKKNGYVEIPEYLYSNLKFKELIDLIFTNIKIIPGLDYQYHEKYINNYIANVKLDGTLIFRSSKNLNRIIFIARKDSQKRRISNEQQVIDFLMDRIPTLEVVYFDGESSAIEQAVMFSDCRCLIGLHGAGLANLFWMIYPQLIKSYVYEITPKDHYFHDFKKKAENHDLNHRYIEVENYEKSEECSVYPRDCILTMSLEEMKKMEDTLIEDGLN